MTASQLNLDITLQEETGLVIKLEDGTWAGLLKMGGYLYDITLREETISERTTFVLRGNSLQNGDIVASMPRIYKNNPRLSPTTNQPSPSISGTISTLNSKEERRLAGWSARPYKSRPCYSIRLSPTSASGRP